MDLPTAIIVYLAIAIFAYAVIYAISQRHWISGIAALIAVIITADAIYRDDVTLLAIVFAILLLLTFVIYFYRLWKNKG